MNTANSQSSGTRSDVSKAPLNKHAKELRINLDSYVLLLAIQGLPEGIRPTVDALSERMCLSRSENRPSDYSGCRTRRHNTLIARHNQHRGLGQAHTNRSRGAAAHVACKPRRTGAFRTRTGPLFAGGGQAETPAAPGRCLTRWGPPRDPFAVIVETGLTQNR